MVPYTFKIYSELFVTLQQYRLAELVIFLFNVLAGLPSRGKHPRYLPTCITRAIM